jgi:hypothetical protein
MLHFLSSLFKPSGYEAGILDRELIEAATERAIDGTDPRLRALGNYRKRLHETVTLAAQHIIALVDGLPSPVEISRRAYGADTGSLQRSLNQLAGVLGVPAHWLSQRALPMRLNYTGIRVEENSGEASISLDLVELYSASGEHRILLPGYIPRT